WAVNVIGALTAAAHILPDMARAGGGSFLATGGMPDPEPRYTSPSLGKAGLRALVSLLASHHGPDGVPVATVTVAGAVGPRDRIRPRRYRRTLLAAAQPAARALAAGNHPPVKSQAERRSEPSTRSDDARPRTARTSTASAFSAAHPERRKRHP